MSCLIEPFYTLLQRGWQPVFAQARTHRRALEHALAGPCVLGRRTLSRTVCALGRAQQDWSADYKIFSRSRWQVDRLFDPVLQEFLRRYPQGPVPVAFDDTRLAKTGKKIATAFWQRDPLSPPFQVNLMYGLRFVQGSVLFPHYREGDFAPRGFPVRFQEAPSLKKPGKPASPEEQQRYRALRRQQNLSTQTREVVRGLRQGLDEQGAASRPLLLALDGSFCNQTFFKTCWDRVHLLARCRKDARLCFPAAAGLRRKYAPEIFTPEQVRQAPGRRWRRVRIYFGGAWRRVKYKQVQGVLWKRGAGRRPLRLIVLAPTPYRTSSHARRAYRQPAYLLSTDRTSSVRLLIQTYFDRWQIEVNHRDEKSLLGVGQAQVRAAQSVPRHPAFAVASYSMLLLAALQTFGPGRTSDYLALPRWRKNARRPSLLDLLTLIRKEINETSVPACLNHLLSKNLILHAHG